MRQTRPTATSSTEIPHPSIGVKLDPTGRTINEMMNAATSAEAMPRNHRIRVGTRYGAFVAQLSPSPPPCPFVALTPVDGRTVALDETSISPIL